MWHRKGLIIGIIKVFLNNNLFSFCRKLEVRPEGQPHNDTYTYCTFKYVCMYLVGYSQILQMFLLFLECAFFHSPHEFSNHVKYDAEIRRENPFDTTFPDFPTKTFLGIVILHAMCT